MIRTPQRRWTKEEFAWAQDCREAGDSVADIADAAGCSQSEVIANIGPERLSPLQREVVSFYVAGTKFKDIDIETGRTGCARIGKASASVITSLRRRGHHIPHRHTDPNTREAIQ